MKKLLFIFLACALSAACGMLNSANSNANANANTSNKPANTNTNSANSNTGSTANAANTANTSNTNSEKPADSGPKRITFGKGQTSGAENVTLAPGESRKFVIGVKAGQLFSIDSSAKDATISIITKGKTADPNEDDGHYDATTTADGDIVFQISNGTKKPFKTSINVNIETED